MNLNNLNQAKVNPDSYENHYQSVSNVFGRRILFLNMWSEIKKFNKKNQESDQKQEIQAQTSSMMYEQSSLQISRYFLLKANSHFSQKQKISIIQIFKLFFTSTFKNFLTSFIYLFLEVIFRLSLSILLYQLFIAVENQQIAKAYILAGISGVVAIISKILQANGFYYSAIIGTNFGSIISFSIFYKMTQLSKNTIKSASLGKVTNMLSSDLNILNKFILLMSLFVAPFSLIGITIIVILRFNIQGIIILVLFILIIPIQTFIGNFAGKMLGKVNNSKDSRIKMIKEIVNGIKFIKMYGWEIPFLNKINYLRKKQQRHYSWYNLFKNLQRTFALSSTYIGGYLCLLCFFLIQRDSLTVAKIFSLLQILSYLKNVLKIAGPGLSYIFELKNVFDRFSDILNIQNDNMIHLDEQFIKTENQKNHCREQKQIKKQENPQNQEIPESGRSIIKKENTIEDKQSQDTTQGQIGEIIFQNFQGFWKNTQKQNPYFKNINLVLKKGNLYGLGGLVGSGKTSLLDVIIKNFPYYKGRVYSKGIINYTEQEPVIFMGTIKENIVFGRPFNEQQYNQSLQYSCLEADLKILKDGDETLLSDRGLNLSGGQKARISLARALYQEGDIYIFDGILSAIDSKVGKQIFSQTIKKKLKEKTVIIVTHNTSFLKQCDKIIMMKNGQIDNFGDPNEINGLQLDQSHNYQEQSQLNSDQLQKLKANLFLMKKQSLAAPALQQQKKSKNIQVGLLLYLKFFFYPKRNYFFVPLTLLFFLTTQGILTVYFRFLANYNQQINQSSKNSIFNTISDFWTILGILMGSYFVFMFIKYLLIYKSMQNSNQKLHKNMSIGILRSRLTYFEKNDSGKIINHFSNDMVLLDTQLTLILIDVVQQMIITIVMMINLFQINYFFIIIGVINLVFGISVYLYCKKPVIHIRQLDLIYRAPLFSKLNELIEGSSIIEIYKQKVRILEEFSKAVDKQAAAYLIFKLTSRTFSYIIVLFYNFMFLIALIIGVALTNAENAGLYGVSVIFFIEISDVIQWIIRRLTQGESTLLSFERNKLICEIQPEKQWRSQYDEINKIPSSDYHNKKQKTDQQDLGTISHLKAAEKILRVEDFSMRYQKSLPTSLKRLSFDLTFGQKIAIVGRTGAGKSSIIHSMFRLSQPEQTSTYQISGFDAKKMGLHTLRQNMSIIPQTPFIFPGTFKQNLDPFNLYSQQQIKKTLSIIGLKETVDALQNKLQSEISNNSQNLSMGQKQLICLARVILQNNKILFLDEATSNVDTTTDNMIQNILKQKFKDTTIVTIAHKLVTIADYDRIIVMEKGRIAQIGTPSDLLEIKGIFYQMVSHAGDLKQKIYSIAKKKKISNKKESNILNSQPK